jgi:5-methylcytosine-specific restriction endonuclease McrA
MPRSVKPWTGKTDDAMPPPRVRQRVFDAHNGVCHYCKLPIKVPGETWQADHVRALILGGENREENLAPIHSHCHVAKTGEDTTRKAKAAAVRQKHIGAVKPKGEIKSRGFPARERNPKPSLPPRRIYEAME